MGHAFSRGPNLTTFRDDALNSVKDHPSTKEGGGHQKGGGNIKRWEEMVITGVRSQGPFKAF